MRTRTQVKRWIRRCQFTLQVECGLTRRDMADIDREAMSAELHDWASESWGIWDERQGWLREAKKRNAKGDKKVWATASELGACNFLAHMRGSIVKSTGVWPQWVVKRLS